MAHFKRRKQRHVNNRHRRDTRLLHKMIRKGGNLRNSAPWGNRRMHPSKSHFKKGLQ